MKHVNLTNRNANQTGVKGLVIVLLLANIIRLIPIISLIGGFLAFGAGMDSSSNCPQGQMCTRSFA